MLPAFAQQLEDPYEMQLDAASTEIAWRNVKLEGLAFKLPEHESKQIFIEPSRTFRIGSGRLSFKPAESWTLQLSRKQHGRLDQLDPDQEIRRTTLSVLYEQPNWQTTLALGRSANVVTGNGGYVLESIWKLRDIHTVFGRFERGSGNELFNEGETLYGTDVNARQLALGYIYEFARSGPLKLGVGAVASRHFIPADQAVLFGDVPASYRMFMRMKVQLP